MKTKRRLISTVIAQTNVPALAVTYILLATITTTQCFAP